MADSPTTTPSAAVDGSQSGRSAPTHDGKAPKREQVAAACLQCRSKKVKCDAIRPSCGRCRHRGLGCAYDVADEGTTKLEDAKRRNEEVQEQLEGMRELYGYLARRPLAEATQILTLTRAHPDDPFAVLRAIQEADLLLLRRATGPQS